MTQPLNLNVAPIIIFQMDIYIYYKKDAATKAVNQLS